MNEVFKSATVEVPMFNKVIPLYEQRNKTISSQCYTRGYSRDSGAAEEYRSGFLDSTLGTE